MLVILSLVPLSFLNPAWKSGSSWFTYCWSLAWRILSVTLLVCEICAVVWALFGIAFFVIGMKTDIFQSCGHCWVFQICWHIECSTFTATSFRIWNSSAGIPSPPLALFVVMLPKDHLTSPSGISGSRWVITYIFIITEMQIRITKRYLLTLVRMANIKMYTNNKCWQGCVEKRTLAQRF